MRDTSSTIFIVDDDPSVRRSLARVMRHEGLETRIYGSAEEFLAKELKPPSHPSCMVVDLHMPGLSGLELQRRLACSPMASCPIIFISGGGDIASSVLAMRQGAVTFLAKPFDNGELLKAIAEALDRHRHRLSSDAFGKAVAERMEALTGREREVMQWVVTGALNKQIAGELGIAERTVKAHRAQVMEKMGVVSVAELVKLCTLGERLPASCVKRPSEAYCPKVQ